MTRPLFPFLLTCLSALVLLVGTSVRLPGGGPSAPAAAEALLAQAVADPLAFDAAEIIERLGPPQRITARPVANAYDPAQADTFRTLVYPGLTLSLYEATGAGKSILSQFVVTDPAYAAPSGLRVGMVHEEVLERIGAPDSRSRERYVYEATETRPSDLTIRFEEGHVTEMNWVVFFE